MGDTRNFTLRPACAADAATVAALSVQVFLDTYATDGIRPDLAREALSEYSEQAFAQRLGQADRAFMLAETGAGLLGYAEVVLAPLPAPAGQVSGAQLVRLYIQPAAQRSGIGRALLERAEQLVRAAAIPSLWLTAWDGNARARAFYAHMGYADVGATSYAFQGHTYANRVLARSFRGSGRDMLQNAHINLETELAAYVIFDVEIRDPAQYQEFMNGVKPAVEQAGGKYLARGGAHKVYEGDWEPRRIVLFEFPSVAAFESFYNGEVYRNLKPLRDACSSARLVSVEGLA